MVQSSLFTRVTQLMGVKTHTSSYNQTCMTTIDLSPQLSWTNPRAVRFLQKCPECSSAVCFLGLALGLWAICFPLRLRSLIILSSVLMCPDSCEGQMTRCGHRSSPRRSGRLGHYCRTRSQLSYRWHPSVS